MDALAGQICDLDGGGAAAAAEIERQLDDMGLTHYAWIPPAQLGPHMSNRRIMPHEVPRLMREIVYDGFTLKATEHALCVEEVPDSTSIEHP